MNEPFEYIAGCSETGGILIIGDHASSHVPSGVDLGISDDLLGTHIAVDLGSAGVVRKLHEKFGASLFLATISRLVVDLNRHRSDPAAIPLQSDGNIILGNRLDEAGREARLKDYYDRYHEALEAHIARIRPDFLLFLHSFTPALQAEGGDPRPWHFGVMYDQDERGGHVAVELFSETAHITGDQLPYSGKTYNSSLHRHGDRNNIPYIGLEMRQDLIADDASQDAFAQIIGSICQKISQKLASA